MFYVSLYYCSPPLLSSPISFYLSASVLRRLNLIMYFGIFEQSSDPSLLRGLSHANQQKLYNGLLNGGEMAGVGMVGGGMTGGKIVLKNY